MAVENEREAKAIFAGYSLWKNENKSFNFELDSGFEALWVTDAHCSCAFYSEPYDPEAEAEKLRKRFSKSKYRKKGWTQERIEREVEHILNNKSKTEGGLSEPLFLCLQSYVTKIGRCYFHVGWYSGDQTKQGLKIDVRSKVSVSLGAINVSEIDKDVLYTFT